MAQPVAQPVAHNLLSRSNLQKPPAADGEQEVRISGWLAGSCAPRSAAPCRPTPREPQPLIARVLDKGGVGGELGRREREDAPVGREGGAGIRVTALVRPEEVGGVVEAEADEVGAAVGLPQELAGALGKEEIRSDFRRRSDLGAGGRGGNLNGGGGGSGGGVPLVFRGSGLTGWSGASASASDMPSIEARA